MSPKKSDRVEALVKQTLDLPPKDRAAFIKSIRLEDESLGRELAALVEDNQKTDPMDEPAPDPRDLSSRSSRFFTEGELVLDRFRIVRFLGRGGMGEVYEARDLQLGQVALKTIRSKGFIGGQDLARFRREVQLARKVTDKHVCRIYDLFTIPARDGRPSASFLTMEYLPGETLADRLARDGALPLDQAESIALQCCSALQAIHDSGVIHRDFKSRNIMLVPRNGKTHAVVMDLGLAGEAAAASDDEPGLTKPGAIMGTPENMAPEQFQGQTVTSAADIYALGIVFYELVTGKHPFSASTPLAAAILRARRSVAASSVREGLPACWDVVINRCLEYEPGQRWGSPRQVAEALQKPVPLDVRPLTRTWFSPWRRFGLTAILLVAAAAGLLWYKYPYSPPPAEAQRWYTRGIAAIREGTYFKAVNALEQAIQLDPSFALAHARLADAWSELDFTPKAQDEILQASSLESRHGLPDIDHSYLDAVRSTLTYDYDAAVSDYRKILAQSPDTEKAFGYVDLGRIHEKQLKLLDAAKDYQEAARLAPEDPAPFVRLGMLRNRQGNGAEGERAFAQADDLYRASSNVEGRGEIAYQRGYFAMLRGDTARARDDFARSFRTAQDIDSVQLEIRTLIRMSVLEYQVDNNEKAVELAEKSLALAREKHLEYWNIDALVRLGNAYYAMGDSARGEQSLQDALQQASEGKKERLAALACWSLASIRDGQDKPEETIEYAQKALVYYQRAGFVSESTLALTLIARSYEKKGEFAQVLQRATGTLDVARKINNPIGIMHAEELIGKVNLSLENYPEALAHYQAALASARSVNQAVDYQMRHCAEALWRLGRYAEAKDMLASIPPAAAEQPAVAVNVDLINGEILLSRLDSREAFEIARRKLSEPSLNPSDRFDFELLGGTAASQTPIPSQALVLCRQALDQAEKKKDVELTAQAELCLANADVKARDYKDALPLAESAERFFAKSEQTESHWRALLTLARTYRESGNSTQAKKISSEAIDILNACGHNWGDLAFETYCKRPDIRAQRVELIRLVQS